MPEQISPEPISGVPTNIVTGFLGAGKSTVIQQLISHKPASERWAILINEFGEVGLDASLMSEGKESGVFFREVPGGCMCCVAGIPMQMALNLLLAKARPHRLLIEPTGLGHPREVLAGLSAEHYRDVLDIRATLTLVDARKIGDERYTSHDTFNEQLEVADIIVASKADAYGEGDLENLQQYLHAQRWGQDKPLVPSSHGRLALEVLEAPAGSASISVGSNVPSPGAPSETIDAMPEFPPEGFLRFRNEGEGFVSHGWIFEPSWVFDLARLRSLVTSIQVERLKAAMKTEHQFVGWNIVPETMAQTDLPEQPDSRIEIICNSDFDARSFERALVATRRIA